MNIKLSSIFIPESDKIHYYKEDLLALEMRRDFIDEIAKRLDLTYLDSVIREGNLCFINSDQLQPEYNMIFSKSDVIAYLRYAILRDTLNIKSDEVPFPENANYLSRSNNIK